MNRPGTLRAEGQASIMIDKPTRSRLKQLASDMNMPVAYYVRELAIRELKAQGKGGALPGQEHFVSSNTISSVKADTTKVLTQTGELMGMVEGFMALLAFSVAPWAAGPYISKHHGKVDTSFSKDKAQITALASKLRQVAQTIEGQLSMPAGGGIVE